MNVKITGLESVTKMLHDAEQALKSINGELAALSINPNNPQAASSEMERLVDANVAPYRGTALVDQITQASKQTFRAAILEKAKEAKHNCNG